MDFFARCHYWNPTKSQNSYLKIIVNDASASLEIILYYYNNNNNNYNYAMHSAAASASTMTNLGYDPISESKKLPM